MAHDPRLRAADSDRERVAAALREHHAVGRLTLEEFQERLEKAYQAKTLGDLDALLVDLPEQDLYELPVPAHHRSTTATPRSAASPTGRAARGVWQGAWVAWATVSLVNFVIWLIVSVTTVQFVYPWWIWVAGPWGAVLLAGRLFGAPSPLERHDRHELRRRARAEMRDRRRELRRGRRDGGLPF